MGVIRHGLSVGIERVNDESLMTFKAIGKLTHEDYEVITPTIDSALEGVKKHKVKALFDASEFEGWELRAAWDDFKIGLKHGNQFGKIAIYGNKSWLEKAAKVGSWFMSGDVKYFESLEQAVQWLGES